MEVEKQNPSSEKQNQVSVGEKKKPAAVPSSKGHRPWKTPKQRPSRAMRRVACLKLSLEEKNRKRQQRDALMRVVKAAKEADANMKRNERLRREEKRKRKEENEMRSTKKIVVTDPKKIAKMSKKQYLRYVHQGQK